MRIVHVCFWFVSHVSDSQHGRSVGKANAGVSLFEGVNLPMVVADGRAGEREGDSDGERESGDGTLFSKGFWGSIFMRSQDAFPSGRGIS